MSVFVVIATKGHETIRARLESLAGSSGVLEVKSDVWLVDFPGTTQDLSERSGIKNGEVGSALVVAMANYSGRQKTDVWEWLKVHAKDI